MAQKPQKFCVNKPSVRKIDKREHGLEKRVAGTCLVEITHNLVTSAAKKIGIPASTLLKIRKKAVTHAKENDFPLTDLSNYKNNPQSGKPVILSISKTDQLSSYVVSMQENWNKLAAQHIQELNFNILISTFTQIIYDRGYGRRVHS